MGFALEKRRADYDPVYPKERMHFFGLWPRGRRKYFFPELKKKTVSLNFRIVKVHIFLKDNTLFINVDEN